MRRRRRRRATRAGAGRRTQVTMGQRALRICHVSKYHWPARGGIERHVRTLALAQARLGAIPSILCTNHLDAAGRDVSHSILGSTRTARELDAGLPVQRVGRWCGLARFDFCRGLRGIVARIHPREVDLVHLHTPNPAMLLALRRRLHPDVPVVVSHHSDVVRQRLLRRLVARAERQLYARAGAILASSETYAAGSALLRRFDAKVVPLPLGIDLRPFARPSPRALAFAGALRRRHGGPLWLCVGRLVYYKGFEFAIDALRHVPGRLLIIGGGPLEAPLRRRACRRGVAGRVAWLGQVDDDRLVGAYLAAEALWFPSVLRSEAFGLAQVEAMAAGCPVINTRIEASGVTWVSPHGVCALSVPTHDAAALAAAARRLLEEPHLRDDLSRAGIRRAHGKFDALAMARQSLEIYRKVLGERPQDPDQTLPVTSARDGDERPAPEELVHARSALVLGQPLRRR